MKSIVEGQILWLRIRLDYYGVFEDRHPYLIIRIDDEENTVEIGQFHSLEGKEFEALRESNAVVYASNPVEEALPKDSFMQMDNLIKLEYYEGLSRYLKTTVCLSGQKKEKVLKKYTKYHENHVIREDHTVYMDRNEIEKLNT